MENEIKILESIRSYPEMLIPATLEFGNPLFEQKKYKEFIFVSSFLNNILKQLTPEIKKEFFEAINSILFKRWLASDFAGDKYNCHNAMTDLYTFSKGFSNISLVNKRIHTYKKLLYYLGQAVLFDSSDKETHIKLLEKLKTYHIYFHKLIQQNELENDEQIDNIIKDNKKYLTENNIDLTEIEIENYNLESLSFKPAISFWASYNCKIIKIFFNTENYNLLLEKMKYINYDLNTGREEFYDKNELSKSLYYAYKSAIQLEKKGSELIYKEKLERYDDSFDKKEYSKIDPNLNSEAEQDNKENKNSVMSGIFGFLKIIFWLLIIVKASVFILRLIGVL